MRLIKSFFLLIVILFSSVLIFPAAQAATIIRATQDFQVNPKIVGVGQSVLIQATITPFQTGNTYSSLYLRINKPNGAIEILGPYSSTNGGFGEWYETTLIGTYLFSFYGEEEIIGGDTYSAFESFQIEVLVQEDPVGFEPTASFTYSPQSPIIGETVNFDASASYTPFPVLHWWSVKDAQTGVLEASFPSSDAYATYSFPEAKVYNITLEISDFLEQASRTTKQIEVSAPSNYPPTISEIQGPVSSAPGYEETFSVTGFDPDGDPLTYEWRVDGAVQAQTGSTLHYTFQPGSPTHTIAARAKDSHGAYSEWSTKLVFMSMDPGPPVVVVTPSTQTVETGEEAILTATVTGGTPPFGYRWYDGLTYAVLVGSSPSNQLSVTKYEPGIYYYICGVQDSQSQSGWSEVVEVVVKPQGYISEFESIFKDNSVSVIYPSDLDVAKPLGCGSASVSDWLASMAVTTKLDSYREGLDTDPNFVNQVNGRAIAYSESGIVSFGGPFINPIIKYSESESTSADDQTPIRFQNSGGTFGFIQNNGAAISGAELDVSYINNDKDMFVIEVFRDADDRNVLLCYGFGWKGTYAAGKYFDQIIYPDLNSYQFSWIVVKWEDTNGNGFVNNPNDGDNYTVIATG